MSAIIKQLTDKENANDLLPITNIKAVYDDNGNRLDNILKQSGGNLISDAYNPSKTYSAGEFCIYSNTLWKSKVNNNTGNTPAEGSYWTATNVGNEINNSKWKKQGEYTPSQEFTLPTTGEIMLIAEVPNRWNQAILYTIAERIQYPPIMLLSSTPGHIICLIEIINGKYKITRAELGGTDYINDPTTKIIVYYR